MSDNKKDAEVTCSRGLVPFCQSSAIAEAKGTLPAPQKLAWMEISGECPTTCVFNKDGRDRRARQAAEENQRRAYEHEVSELRNNAHGWANVLTG